MISSGNSDPDVRQRANELLVNADYRVEETAAEFEERTAITSKGKYLFITLGILFSIALVVIMASLNISAPQRNLYLFIIAKCIVLLAAINYYIKAYVPLGRFRPRFIRYWKALGAFSISYCVTLLFVVVIP